MRQADSEPTSTRALVMLVIVLLALLVVSIVVFGQGCFVRPKPEALIWLPISGGLWRYLALAKS